MYLLRAIYLKLTEYYLKKYNLIILNKMKFFNSLLTKLEEFDKSILNLVIQKNSINDSTIDEVSMKINQFGIEIFVNLKEILLFLFEK